MAFGVSSLPAFCPIVINPHANLLPTFTYYPSFPYKMEKPTLKRSRHTKCCLSSRGLETDTFGFGHLPEPLFLQDGRSSDATDPYSDFGCAEFLAQDITQRISSILLSDKTSPPTDALPIVVDELRQILVPEDESGRVSIWTTDSSNIRMVATGAQGDAEDDMEGLDAAFDAKDDAFLYGLSRDDSDHGLFKSKSEIMDQRIPNAPGYDQLMYAATLHRGTVIAVIGVGRRFQQGGEQHPWTDVHLASVRAVADMLECAFVKVEGEAPPEEKQIVKHNLTSSMAKQYIIDEQYKEMSFILGKVAERCDSHGLLSVSLWEYDHGDLLLYPGRRTRESVVDTFEETSIDSCEIIEVGTSSMCKIVYLLARVDSILLQSSGGDDCKLDQNDGSMEGWLKDINRSVRGTSPMTRQIGSFTVDADGGFEALEDSVFKSNKAIVQIDDPLFAAKISGVMNEDSSIILVPVIFRGELCSVLSFAIDAQAAKDPKTIPAIINQSLYARKKMKSLSWKVQIMQSKNIELPNLQSLMSKIRSGNAVALTGAGFSMPAKLMSWSGLLRALLSKAKDTSRVDTYQYDFIEGLISTGTADSFDQAAQSLEDSLGKEPMNQEISQLLAIDSSAMPRVMQRRIKIFNDIPWRAVLTTNYDLCLSGPTPKCPDVGDAYISSLRQGNKRIGEQLTEKINAPVVKLHGCVNRGNIVFTRSGYRELLYRNSGYKVFLQSLMASHTFVSIGHSGTDAYLNDLNSELLTMFDQSNLPLRYSIAPVSEGHASFAKRYDGLNFITWDKDTYGWGVVDYILLKLRIATNPRIRFSNLLRGRRILLVDSPNASPLGWTLVELASLVFGILPSATVHILDDPTKLQQTTMQAVSSVAPYDIILMVFDKETSPTEIESIRTSKHCHAPFAIIRSDCTECHRGILALQGRILPLVIRDLEDAAEELFMFLDNAKAMHGDKNVRFEKRAARPSVSMQAFL